MKPSDFACFPDLFFHQVENLHNKVALRHKDYGIWNRITWTEYGSMVTEAAAAMIASGLDPGDRIAILGDNRPEWMICHLAAMSAGGVTCGIYSTSSPEEIQYVVDHSESKLFFVENEEQTDKVMEIIDALDVRQVIIWDPKGLWGFSHDRVIFYDRFIANGRAFLEANPDAVDRRREAIERQDTAMLIYTSGTTGRPKGAMISHWNILVTTESYLTVYPSSGKDEVLSYLPLAHIYENLLSVFQGIASGATVNFVESLPTLAQNLTEVSPTIFASVPRIWEKFVSAVEIRMADSTWSKRKAYRWAINTGIKYIRVKEAGHSSPGLSIAYRIAYWGVLHHLRRLMGLERLRYGICGAAPAGGELFEWYNAMGIKLREAYGQTETTCLIAATPVAAPRYGFVGPPIPGMEVKIAEDGEILARGQGVFKGYFKNAELTAKTIDPDGWLATGDVGVLEDGYLKVMDRKKDILITSGGKNITPAYIENKLKFSTYIQDAVVVGDGRNYLTALVLIDEDNVNKYALDNRVPYTTFEDLTRNEQINQLIEKEIAKVNKTLARVETIKKFRLLPRRFYAEDGDVTPTQKVKRAQLEKRYHHLIEEMYGG